jgi:hypothetical protein
LKSRGLFARGLSDRFVSDLELGKLSPVLCAACDLELDVQIRDGYVDIYSRGNSVPSVRETGAGHYVVRIHRKFVSEPHGCSTGNYVQFALSDEYLMSCGILMKGFVDKASPYAKKEAPTEEQIIRASLRPGSSVVFFDRQIQIPGDPLKLRPDLIGLTQDADAEPRLVLTELKCGLDNRIQDLMGTMQSYYDTFAPNGHLREDIVAAYSKVVTQKVRLGLLPPSIRFPEKSPTVDCLIILYNYNRKSDLLRRLSDRAKSYQLKPWLVELPANIYKLPSLPGWGKV